MFSETDNERRIELIEKDISTRSLTTEENAELRKLESAADEYLRSLPANTELENLVERLKSEGKWVETLPTATEQSGVPDRQPTGGR